MADDDTTPSESAEIPVRRRSSRRDGADGDKAPGTSTAAILARDLIAERRDDRKRDEREHERTLNHLARSGRMWFLMAMAELVVIGMIVAGLLGVGVTGRIPGVGNVTITPPAQTPTTTPAEP